MSGAIYQAASGALLQQMRLEVLSNNLANINTAGYKADRSSFRLSPGAIYREFANGAGPAVSLRTTL